MSKNPSVNPISHTATDEFNDINSSNVSTGSNIGRFDQAKKSLSQVKDSITNNAGKVGRGVTTLSHNATDYAQQNPGKALAIAIGTGVAIGYLIGATTRRNTFWTGVTAAVIGAVADRIR